MWIENELKKLSPGGQQSVYQSHLHMTASDFVFSNCFFFSFRFCLLFIIFGCMSYGHVDILKMCFNMWARLNMHTTYYILDGTLSVREIPDMNHVSQISVALRYSKRFSDFSANCPMNSVHRNFFDNEVTLRRRWPIKKQKYVYIFE